MPVGNPLVGTWHLEAFEIEFQADGRRQPSMGERPRGRFIFTEDGWASSLITAEGRCIGSSDAEQTALMRSMIALSGRYLIEGNRLLFDVDNSWNEAWTGVRQERFVDLRGDRVKLSTAWMASPWHPGEPTVRVVLSWARAAASDKAQR
jgi:hypothetical protein